MKRIFTLCVFFYSVLLQAQPNLHPSIGIGALPNDSDTICYFPVFTGNYDASGYSNGDTIPDFTLYTPAGVAVNMQTVLSQGRPVLLVGGNLTCPVFRGKIATINNMAAVYAGLLDIYIVYGMEAHPTTPSPYSGAVWTTSANQQSGILYPQPTTYGERKALIDTLLTLYTINVPILVDGTCNEWLSNFGPAPNNAYLIDTTGIIYEKQGWYHKLPDDMYCEIDSMLGTNSGQCNAAGNNGNFSFSYVYDTIESGEPGDILGVHATLTNNSATDNVVIDIFRLQGSLPGNWQTAMCVDVCLSTATDTTQVTIPPATTQDFIFYFYTDPVVDSIGLGRVRFRNANNGQNNMVQKFWGLTESRPTSNIFTEEKEDLIQFYPNPSSGMLYFSSEERVEGHILVLDLNGRLVKDFGTKYRQQELMNLSDLPSGMYILQFVYAEGVISKKILLK